MGRWYYVIIMNLKMTIVVFIIGVLMVMYGLLSIPDIQVPTSTEVRLPTPTDIVWPTKPLEIFGEKVKPQLFLVERVIDGDTLQLSNRQTVRYIGIDTPEIVDTRKKMQCFGIEAAEKNKELAEGKNVRLEKDVSEVDRYGRLLRYVYVQSLEDSEEVFINDYLVRNGFAHTSSFPPDIKYQSQFRDSQNYARLNNLGLWASCQ